MTITANPPRLSPLSRWREPAEDQGKATKYTYINIYTYHVCYMHISIYIYIYIYIYVILRARNQIIQCYIITYDETKQM